MNRISRRIVRRRVRPSLVSHRSFKLGRVVSTPNALNELNPKVIFASLVKHANGNWGDCCPQDKRSNDHAVKYGGRIFSVYHDNGTKFWIITEADRSATTILLPEDY